MRNNHGNSEENLSNQATHSEALGQALSICGFHLVSSSNITTQGRESGWREAVYDVIHIGDSIQCLAASMQREKTRCMALRGVMDFPAVYLQSTMKTLHARPLGRRPTMMIALASQRDFKK